MVIDESIFLFPGYVDPNDEIGLYESIQRINLGIVKDSLFYSHPITNNRRLDDDDEMTSTDVVSRIKYKSDSNVYYPILFLTPINYCSQEE